METKHGLLNCRSVRRKPPGEQWNRRETVEVRGKKWNFDVEVDSGIPGPQVTSRPDEGMPTVTAREEIPTVPPPAPPPEEHVPEIRGHSISGGGDVAAKTEMVICDPSYTDPAKTKVIGKVVRYTNILEAPIPDPPNEDGKVIDTGQIIIAQKLQERENDIYVTMVSWEHCVTSKDRYITFVSTVTDRCNFPGIRVPKHTRWRPQRIHCETYCQVRGRMLGHCSTAEWKGSDDAFDGTEEFESA